MKILIYSPQFYPAVGGLETVVELLAREFVAQGHEVKLVCQIPDEDSKKTFSYEVYRRPSPMKLIQLTRWCNVYFQPNISLKGLYPLLLVPKPWVVAHNNWYSRSSGSLGWQDILKNWVTHLATNISVSQAVAKRIPAPSIVIPNPYHQQIFHFMPEIKRDRTLVFLGRLVSQKGVDVLLDAIAQLKQKEYGIDLTIIGDGPEAPLLKKRAENLEILDQVQFIGIQTGKELAQFLNRHHILVVPSRLGEAFGLVALEGIACGCVVVGTSVGGLPEAIGPCGITFPDGDVAALTEILADLLNHPDQWAEFRRKAVDHLAHHQKAAVAAAYLEVFQAALQAPRINSLNSHAD
jgi:glycosyltransferase involved in cell wall biosynthesis